jgi:hypothetical protein
VPARKAAQPIKMATAAVKATERAAFFMVPSSGFPYAGFSK